MKLICLFVIIVGLHDVSKASGCTSRGRFPNNDEDDCRGYTMCLPMGGDFMQYNLTCPLGSVYSHTEQLCTTATTYSCLSNYTCTVPGSYESFDNNCRSYIACVMGLVDLVAARQVLCPGNQLFSPGVGCVNATEYVCNTVTEVAVTEVSFQSDDVPLNSSGERLSVLPMLLVGCVIKCI